MKKVKHQFFNKFIFILIAFNLNAAGYAQCWERVWADEFDGTTLDNSKWEYGIGTSNDNVHYYTARDNNVTVSDGTLKLIALEESYQGMNYTSGLIKTSFISAWRYGRIEARINLPHSPGFVPAFWMLPEDNIYGWWPNSGEIDIMEHPTNEIDKIYGTVHTEAYNSFTGSGPVGSTVTIPTAETEFHVYAVEWTESQIDFYVDDQKYFTFYNNGSGSSTWPFNNHFYLILNLAVGGGWVGSPNSSTVFPAIMEVDYVRVYQNLSDINISGPDYILENAAGVTYSLPAIDNAIYTWNMPADVEIVSGQGTNEVITNWGTVGGNISAEVQVSSCTQLMDYAVNVSANYIANPSFEKGVKYWNKVVGYPADADLYSVSSDAHEGNNSLKIEVKKLGNYDWDIQLSQKEFELKIGKDYEISFWAKAENGIGKINATLINSDNFFVYVSKSFTLTDGWVKYTLSYKSNANNKASLNIDFGSEIGIYYLDDFLMIIHVPQVPNAIVNYDFSNGTVGWALTVLGSAVATGAVESGEYKISITNGGNNPWDIFLGQTNLLIEKGKEYIVSFDVYAEAPRTISALVGKNSSPWTVYSGNNIIPITTSKQTYTYTFIMNSTTDIQARLGFDVGGFSEDVFFDNIYLTQKVTSVSDNYPFNNTFSLNQNYPNPFNPSTTISFQFAEASVVRLSVYNLLGEEVSVLLNNEFKPAGYHSEVFHGDQLSSGIYIYTLKVGNNIYMNKMSLLK